MAAKEAKKKQPKQHKKNGKKSLIVILRYKKASNSLSKLDDAREGLIAEF